jgi:inhibitor of KinA sporulation pathway (predicted exonuclease)
VGAGVPFLGTCHALKKDWEARDHVWASYGDYDRSQFERQCGRLSVPYPFGKTHVNVKALLALVAGWPKEVGMDEALHRVGLPLVGTHHRAVDDVRNIACLLSLVLEAGRISFKHVEKLGETLKEA